MAKRRKYTDDLKRESVRLMQTRGERTVADVAESLGVHEGPLHDWKKKFGDVTEDVRGERGETPEDELRRLRRENAQLKRDKEILEKKPQRLRKGGLVMDYEFVRAESANFAVRELCDDLEVSRSAYYEWLAAREPGPRAQDRALTARIRAIFQRSRRRCGAPRVQRAMCEQGVRVARKRAHG